MTRNDPAMGGAEGVGTPQHRTSLVHASEARHVEQVVRSATVEELLDALTSSPWPTCPMHDDLPVWDRPHAEIDGLGWTCGGHSVDAGRGYPPRRRHVPCDGGTLWAARSLVLRSRPALNRLLEVVAHV